MKPAHVAAFATLGMVLSSALVYAVTPVGGFSIAAVTSESTSTILNEATLGASTIETLGEMAAGTTLRVEGRLAFKTLAQGGNGETHLLLDVGSDKTASKQAAPVNLAIVVDRSGSMKGTRLRNAISGAMKAAERLNDGDVVSVVAFDSKPLLVVPPTVMDSSSRNRVRSDIAGIVFGGDTCISCGIEEALTQLDKTTGRVNRMIVLSDGEATAGVRDIPGFRSIAQRAVARGTGITTIGVDVDYNERILSSIAQDSNGRHYFVSNDSGLETVFDREAESVTSAVASNAEVSVELPPGVELVRVVDRTFRRNGNRVIFPLGVFAAGENKSILLQLKVPSDKEGKLPVANVDLTFRDHVKGTDERCGGKLDVLVSAGGKGDVDAVVDARVNRTKTADTLREAADLFKQGRADEARQKLEERRKTVVSVAASAKAKTPSPKFSNAAKDLDAQQEVLQRAESSFATPPASKGGANAGPADPFQGRTGKEGVKQGAEDELNLRR